MSSVHYPNVVKFLKRHLVIDDCLSAECRQMILNELAKEVVSKVALSPPGGGDSLDLYDIQCLLTFGCFKIYPSMYDLGDSNFASGIEDVDDCAFDDVKALIRALNKDKVDLSHLWTEDETSITWIFQGEKFTYDKSSNKLSHGGEETSGDQRRLRKALRRAFCPKRELLKKC